MTMTLCPCCGSRCESRLPIVDLNTNIVSFGERTIRAHPRAIEILYAMERKHPGTTSLDDLRYMVWTGDEYVSDNNIRTWVWHARNAAESVGFQITTVHGVGYRLGLAA
jgi:DNA-binding response OmpR family regulator